MEARVHDHSSADLTGPMLTWSSLRTRVLGVLGVLRIIVGLQTWFRFCMRCISAVSSPIVACSLVSAASMSATWARNAGHISEAVTAVCETLSCDQAPRRFPLSPGFSGQTTRRISICRTRMTVCPKCSVPVPERTANDPPSHTHTRCRPSAGSTSTAMLDHVSLCLDLPTERPQVVLHSRLPQRQLLLPRSRPIVPSPPRSPPRARARR